MSRLRAFSASIAAILLASASTHAAPIGSVISAPAGTASEDLDLGLFGEGYYRFKVSVFDGELTFGRIDFGGYAQEIIDGEFVPDCCDVFGGAEFGVPGFYHSSNAASVGRQNLFTDSSWLVDFRFPAIEREDNVVRFWDPARVFLRFDAESDSAFSYRVDILNGVPEPATWAMMIAGFGLIGLSFRAARARGAAPV